jgi:hypothetical protein
MKKLILILATISILSCTKKQDDPKPVVTTTQKQSTPTISSPCYKDSSWTRSHPKTTSLYYFKETCTHITITYAVTKKTVTVLKPVGDQIISNMSSMDFKNSTDPNKIYYELYLSYNKRFVIYNVEEANSIGVGGPGIKF